MVRRGSTGNVHGVGRNTIRFDRFFLKSLGNPGGHHTAGSMAGALKTPPPSPDSLLRLHSNVFDVPHNGGPYRTRWGGVQAP
jgi:hypothetical protein